MNKQTIITVLLALAAVVGQGQAPADLPEYVKNRQMDMEAPLPEPSFEMDTTTVRVHILNWEAGKTPTKMVCLGVASFFPYIADNHTGFTDADGVAIVRFLQRGTSMVSLSVGDGFSKHFYLWPGEKADVYVDVERMTNASRDYMKRKMEPEKDTKFNNPDLAFVYITDHTSPADRCQDYRNRIRGEHLRVNEQQMDALQRRFHITVWPTYILMDRRGRLRELPHNHVEDEILKELENRNK